MAADDEVYLDWLKGVVQGSLNDVTTLWHYTNVDGLIGILKSNLLRATDTTFLNDSAEVSYGRDLVLKVAAQAAVGGVSQHAQALITGLVDNASGILRPWLDGNLRLFVACFCSSEDLLSQWRYYGGHGDAGGYAIGFTPPGPLPAWGQAAPQYLTLRKVIYDESEQIHVTDDLISKLVTYLEVDPQELDRQRGFARQLVNGLVEIASWCKHPAFVEEQEWRLTYRPPSEDLPGVTRPSVAHRPSRGLVVPYVSLQVPRGVGVLHDVLPITHIRCGPSEDPARKIRGVRSLLDQFDRYGDVDVSASEAPARL